VVLSKLSQFQQQGHKVVLIIGDFTARVGDPSGRDTQRPILTPDQIDANAQTFQDQAFKVLDRDATEVRFNSEWLDMPAQELFGLMAKVTVARLLEREELHQRMKADQPISSLEAALSDPPGIRLGGDPLGRRARRHGPEVQSAVRAGHSALLRRARAVGDDHADPPGHRTVSGE